MKTTKETKATKSISAYVEGYRQVKTAFFTPTSTLKALGDNLPKGLQSVYEYAQTKHKKEMLEKIGQRMDGRAARYGKAKATLFDAWTAFYSIVKVVAKDDKGGAVTTAARQFIRAEKMEKQNKKTAEK